MRSRSSWAISGTPNGVRTAMRGQERVFHLAALIAIPFSYHSPDSYVDTNIKGTLNVLNAARELDTQRVLVTSTSEVYGTAQYVPIDEKHPFQGQSPYSATKIGADRLAESFYRSFDLPVTIVRPFNTYGPRQSGRAIIPTIITQLLAGQTEIKHAVLNVEGNFLHAAEAGRDLGIVDVGEVVAGMLAHFPTGTVEEIDGRVFQRAFGQAELENGISHCTPLWDQIRVRNSGIPYRRGVHARSSFYTLHGRLPRRSVR